MELRQLRYCLSVCQTQSYSRTAEMFFTSRQNIRHAIRGIESELGVKLFDSSSGRLIVTSDGEEFALRAAAIMNAVDDLYRDFNHLESMRSRPISLAVDMNIAANYESKRSFLESFSSQECRLIEAQTNECFDMVRARKVDLGLFVSMDKEYPDCEDVLLYEYPAGIMVSDGDPLAESPSLELGDLRQRKLYVPPAFEFRCRELAWECEKSGISIDDISMVNQAKDVIEAIQFGGCVGLGDLGEGDSLKSMGIAMVPFSQNRFMNYGHLVYMPDSPRKIQIERFAREFIASGVWKQHASLSGYDRWAS